MAKPAIDQSALIDMFSQASAKQGEAIRKAVSDATLKALQGRELTLANIRNAVKTVTQATSAGAVKSIAPPMDVEALLEKALDGMDGALLQAVEANRKALQQFADQGADLQSGRLKTALDELEKMEDTFFATVKKATQGGDESLQQPWTQALDAMKLKGSGTGQQAGEVVEQFMTQAQSAIRTSRAAGMQAMQAMMDSYSALVSGVLIGMSEGLQKGVAPAEAASSSRTRKR